jgi:ABC-type multidrug transport system, ATPase and permease components
MSRVTNDVDTIAQALNTSIGQMVSSLTLFVGVLIMMLISNWIMASVALVTTALGFALMMIIISRSQKYFVRQQRQLGRVGGHVEEIFAGHNVVKAYNGEKKAKQEFSEMNTALENSAWKSQFMSGMMMPIMQFTGNLGYVAVCIVGALLVMNGSIGFSVIVAFMIYVRMFTRPLSTLAQAATNLQSAAAAGERAFEFLAEKELADESRKSERLENIKGDVKFQNVRFGYSEDKIIIHDFSALCKSGQK